MGKTLEQRFAAKTLRVGDCLVWQGARNDCQYGQVWSEGRLLYVHRLAYEWAFGPIPDGLRIDHLCRNTLCVEPLHLEAVTHGENIRRGYAHSRATGSGRYARRMTA